LNISLDDPYVSAESYDSIFEKKKTSSSSFSKSARGSERASDFDEDSMDQHTPVKRNREGVSLKSTAFRAQKDGTNNHPKKKVKFDFNGTTGNHDELPVNFFPTLIFFLSFFILMFLFFISYPIYDSFFYFSLYSRVNLIHSFSHFILLSFVVPESHRRRTLQASTDKQRRTRTEEVSVLTPLRYRVGCNL
jgi:hypothetical protein